MLQDTFADKATERKILSLLITCPSEGCQWTGELRSKDVSSNRKCIRGAIINLKSQTQSFNIYWSEHYTTDSVTEELIIARGNLFL